jgi:cytochrome c oxidase subunit 2
VIHSFWVPNLHGKMDLIPGRTNTTVLQASRPGGARAGSPGR